MTERSLDTINRGPYPEGLLTQTDELMERAHALGLAGDHLAKRILERNAELLLNAFDTAMQTGIPVDSEAVQLELQGLVIPLPSAEQSARVIPFPVPRLA